jgi:hypothetical protein
LFLSSQSKNKSIEEKNKKCCIFRVRHKYGLKPSTEWDMNFKSFAGMGGGIFC